MDHKDTKNTKTAILWLVVWFLAVKVNTVFCEPPAVAPSEPKFGTTLIYEIDKAEIDKDAAIATTKVVDVLNRRINPGWLPAARVRRLEDGRIEVGIYGNDAEKAKRIQQIADRSGTLEFRILANRHDDSALVKRAEADANSCEVKDAAGKVEAKWVPVTAKEEKTFIDDKDLATRKPKPGGVEVLVKIDPYNVTGAYLKEAKEGVDPATSRPLVSFQFDATGGERFGQLTKANLPQKLVEAAGNDDDDEPREQPATNAKRPQNNSYRRLGIILDGNLYSAPTIRSAIYDHGQITGNFTHAEVEDLVRVLNAGSLPAKIKLVEKRESKDTSPAKP